MMVISDYTITLLQLSMEAVLLVVFHNVVFWGLGHPCVMMDLTILIAHFISVEMQAISVSITIRIIY